MSWSTGTCIAAALVAVAAASAAPPPPSSPDPRLAKDARTVIARNCAGCHRPGKASGGVDLSTRAAALASVPSSTPAAKALVPGQPAQSRVYRMVADGKMPPTGPLPAAEVELIRRWIEAGAEFPKTSPVTAKAAPAPLWSLKPVRRPRVPSSPFDALAANPVDRFIFEQLARKGLKPSPPAPRLTLLRRVTLDMTGLPPTPEEVSGFLSDRSPDAYEKVVDRLLASPAYGERWARHWLDVVRYGESNGYEQNHLRPNAWHYRDYVIAAFNEDRPYTRFIAEQLAGDQVSGGDAVTEAATGFLVAGVHDTVGNQTEEGTRQQRADDLDDIVSTTGAAFLGLTVGCAKCHDHKFDPIPQVDYYRMAAALAGVRHGERRLSRGQAESVLLGLERRSRPLRQELALLDERARAAVLRAQGTPQMPRLPSTPRINVEEFPPVEARFVRMVIDSTRDGAQPCIDELEVFGADRARNLALAEAGAKASASSLLPGYKIHQVEHVNDGRPGNDSSWISNEPAKGG